MLTVEQLRMILDYDPLTGNFFWKRNQGRVKAGTGAGGKNAIGYITIGVMGTKYLAHRLAWLHYYGKWPEGWVDHKDQIKINNRITNLREATHAQNLWNTTHRRGRKYPKGVSKNGTKYCARLAYKYKSIWLGNFGTIEEASAAYIKASKEIHGKFSIYSDEK